MRGPASGTLCSWAGARRPEVLGRAVTPASRGCARRVLGCWRTGWGLWGVEMEPPSAHVCDFLAVQKQGVVLAGGVGVVKLLDGQRAQRLLLAVVVLLRAGGQAGQATEARHQRRSAAGEAHAKMEPAQGAVGVGTPSNGKRVRADEASAGCQGKRCPWCFAAAQCKAPPPLPPTLPLAPPPPPPPACLHNGPNIKCQLAPVAAWRTARSGTAPLTKA